jgi:uncharacterized protein (TIGR03382 family)
MATHVSPRRAAAFASSAVVSVAATATSALAQNLPDADWQRLRCRGGAMVDARADEPDALGPRDIVGSSDDPAAFVAADDDFFYLRVRLDESPLEPAPPGQTTDLQPFGWGIAIDLDNNRSSYELLLSVDGVNDQLTIRRNTAVTVANSPRDPADDPPAETYPFTDNGRAIAANTQTGGNPDSFLELAFPWADLTPLGATPETRAFVWIGTSSLADRLDGDIACHDAAGGGSDPDLDGNASDEDPLDPDEGPGPGPDAGPGPLPDAGVGGEGPRLEGGGGCSTGGGASIGLAFVVAAFSLRRRRSARARTPA